MMVRKSSECECKQQRGKNFKNFVQASYVLIIFSFPKISHNNNNTTTTTTHNISRRLSGFALPTIASITSEEQPFFTTQRSSRTELGPGSVDEATFSKHSDVNRASEFRTRFSAQRRTSRRRKNDLPVSRLKSTLDLHRALTFQRRNHADAWGR